MARGLIELLGALLLLAPRRASAGESPHAHESQHSGCRADRDTEGGMVYGSDHSVLTSVEVVSSDGVQAHTTYRLLAHLPATSESIYTIYGSPSTAALHFPPSHQEPKPFGADTGGVAPALVGLKPSANYDSWIGLGITDGDSRGRLSSVGVSFDSWDATSPLTSAADTGGSIFFMDPGESELVAPSGHDISSGVLRSVVLAQLTLPTSRDSEPVRFSAQGRSVGHDALDWQETCITVSVGGERSGQGSHALATKLALQEQQAEAALAEAAAEDGATCEPLSDPPGGFWQVETILGAPESLVSAELLCHPGFRPVHTEQCPLSLSCSGGLWDGLCGLGRSKPKCVQAPENECTSIGAFGARADAVTMECCDDDCDGGPTNCSRGCKVLLVELHASCSGFLMADADEGLLLLGTISSAVSTCFPDGAPPPLDALLAGEGH